MSYDPRNLRSIGLELNTQDNRMTAEPMFCVQILVRDVGYDAAYCDKRVWHDSANDQTIYDDDPDFRAESVEGDGWDMFGYVDRWETVMVAFTEVGCKAYLELDGHNVKRRAFRGQIRIYVESFRRCEEMMAIRAHLKALNP